MEDRIYLKTRNDGLWEKNATKGAAVYMIVGTVLFLASINILVSIELFLEHKLGSGDRLFDFITIVWAFSGIFGIAAICILTNQSRNISKSTGFISNLSSFITMCPKSTYFLLPKNCVHFRFLFL